MENNYNYIINDELLTRFLLGETDTEEKAAIENWLKASPENEKMLHRQKMIIDMVSFAKQNVDEEWMTFKKKLTPQTKEIKFESSETKNNYRYLAIAASIAVLIGLSVFFIFYFNNAPKKLMAESKDKIMDVILSDGSNVSLNRNSTLEYPETFGKNNRQVKLNGEAFFKITHDASKPFIVETEQLTVTVLGTEFYVSSFEGQPQQVYVETGKVKCEHKTTGENIILNAGEKYTFGIQNNTVESPSEKEMNQYAWKTARLIFVNEKMTDITQTINNTYGSHIILKGNIYNCTLTVNFEDLTLDGVLNVLQTILDAHIIKKTNTIEISGNGC